MTTLCLLHQAGTKKPTLIVPAQDMKTADSPKVYFCVQSDCEEDAQVVAKTVKAINDTFKIGIPQASLEAAGLGLSIIEPHRWYQDDWRTGDRYIYLYAAPSSMEDWLVEPYKLWDEKSIFYIGEGQGDEQYELIDQASANLEALLRQQPNNPNMLVVQRAILGNGQDSARDMVRKVAFFSGEYDLVACSAAKYYLINHLYGLKNQHLGSVSGGGCKWLCRPKDMLPNTGEWHDLLAEFIYSN